MHVIVNVKPGPLAANRRSRC